MSRFFVRRGLQDKSGFWNPSPSVAAALFARSAASALSAQAATSLRRADVARGWRVWRNAAVKAVTGEPVDTVLKSGMGAAINEVRCHPSRGPGYGCCSPLLGAALRPAHVPLPSAGHRGILPAHGLQHRIH